MHESCPAGVTTRERRHDKMEREIVGFDCKGKRDES